MTEITVHDFDIPRLLREDKRQFGYLCNYVGNHKPELFGISGPRAMFLSLITSTREDPSPELFLKAAEVLVDALKPKTTGDRQAVVEACRLALFPAPAEALVLGADPITPPPALSAELQGLLASAGELAAELRIGEGQSYSPALNASATILAERLDAAALTCDPAYRQSVADTETALRAALERYLAETTPAPKPAESKDEPAHEKHKARHARGRSAEE